MSRVGRFLFVLGIVVIVVELVANIASIAYLSSMHPINMNWSSDVSLLVASLYQGGTLMGLGKIIELLERKR